MERRLGWLEYSEEWGVGHKMATERLRAASRILDLFFSEHNWKPLKVLRMSVVT